jgi:26S proteasome regulatory subunit N10
MRVWRPLARLYPSCSSNLVSIPPGCMPSEVLRSSPIVSENTGASSDGAMGFDASGGVAGVGAGANDDFGGVDPNMDPELAMVLRVSMEDERARQESEAAANPSSPAANNGATAAAAGDDATSANMDVDSAETAPVASPADQQITGGEAEDQELLQQALALSMNDGDAGDMDMDGMDEEMMMALQMSMQMDSASASAPGASATTQPTPTSGMGAEAKEEGTDVASTTPQASTQFHDDGFIANMLESLPGVDPSDPQIQQALQRFQNSNAGGTKDTQKKDEKEK